MYPKFISLLLTVCIVGCGSGADDDLLIIDNTQVVIAPAVTDENLPIPDNASVSEYNVLFMGNSHVLGLAEELRILIEVGSPQSDIGKLAVSTGDYLSERLDYGRSIDILKNETWSYVIFQAQNTHKVDKLITPLLQHRHG